MINTYEKKECVGCQACRDICPVKAITMEEDEDGFLYPYVNEDKCIKCGLCNKTCPLNFKDFSSTENVKAYVGINKSKDIVYNSSSGGAFQAIYETLLREGYTIYGVKFDNEFNVIHDAATNLDDCAKFRKSKYVYSNTNGCFKKIATQLKNKEKVLFTGTPCQCAALQSYLKALNIPRHNLIIVDILCHGAGNQKTFNQYKEELQKKYKSKLIDYKFRSKKIVKNKCNSRSADITFEDRQIHVTKDDDPFLIGYYSALFYRESCGSCHFVKNERASDITIFDAWKIENLLPKYNPLSGVSIILVNTTIGQSQIKDLKKKMNLEEISKEWTYSSQGTLNNRPSNLHPKRKEFFKLNTKYGFYKAVYRCMWKDLIKIRLSYIKNGILKKLKRNQ